MGTKFLYVTFIRASVDEVWDALTRPEFTRRYWAGTAQKSEWTKGASWGAYTPDGRLWDSGEILEADRPRKLSLTWRKEGEKFPEMRAEGFSRLTYELEQQGDTVKLTLAHEIDVDNSTLIGAVAQGWPMVLASLKSMLETGVPLEGSTKWPENL